MREKQPDGSEGTFVDEDMKQSIILNLLEEIPNFPLDEAKRIAETEIDEENNTWRLSQVLWIAYNRVAKVARK